MKKTIYILLFIGFSISGIAQDSIMYHYKKNNAFIELLGSGGLYSLNYERIFIISHTLNMTARIGAEYLPPLKPLDEALAFPISTSILIGRKNDRLEMGISCSYMDQFHDIDNLLLNSLIIGYRFQPLYKHYIIRLTYLPTYIKDLNIPLSVKKLDRVTTSNAGNFALLVIGLSFGYNF
jgi:hypothetical protein